MRIDTLQPGDHVVLWFADSGDGFYECADLLRIDGAGDARQAWFRSHGGTAEWSAYRYKGRWAFGSGAARIRLLGVTAAPRVAVAA